MQPEVIKGVGGGVLAILLAFIGFTFLAPLTSGSAAGMIAGVGSAVAWAGASICGKPEWNAIANLGAAALAGMAVGISTPANAICFGDPFSFYQEYYHGQPHRDPVYSGKTWLLNWSCGRQHPDFNTADLVSAIVTMSVDITDSTVQASMTQAKQDSAKSEAATEKQMGALGDQIVDLKGHEVDAHRLDRIERQVGKPEPPPSLDERVTKAEKAIAELTPAPKPPAKPASHPAVRRTQRAHHGQHYPRTPL